MKRFLALLFLVTAPALRAELPPSAYEKMQKSAPEVLKLLVLRVDVQPTENEAVEEVTMLAEAVKVGRSETKVKPGDMITVKYTVTRREPGWVGPGEVPVLKDDAETVAYLSPLEGPQEYTPAAGAMSFSRFD